jgi:hypothetical protein
MSEYWGSYASEEGALGFSNDSDDEETSHFVKSGRQEKTKSARSMTNIVWGVVALTFALGIGLYIGADFEISVNNQGAKLLMRPAVARANYGGTSKPVSVFCGP